MEVKSGRDSTAVEQFPPKNQLHRSQVKAPRPTCAQGSGFPHRLCIGATRRKRGMRGVLAARKPCVKMAERFT